MVSIKQFTVNPVLEHTYVVSDETGECVIVDPGCLSGGERAAVSAYISDAGLRPVALWFTHLHFDHVWGARHFKDLYSIPTFASAADSPWLTGNADITEQWGLPAPDDFKIDNAISDGQTLQFGNTVAKVLATPGHTAGGVSFYFEADGICLTGDTLFCGSVGRTDFPDGSASAIVTSVRTKLLTLPPDTRILPGHGPDSTVDHEMLYNPYVSGC